MEPQGLPLPVNNRLEQASFFFPEAPGAVVLFFSCLVKQQYVFILETAGMNHVHSQAEACAPGSCNDIIVMLQHERQKKIVCVKLAVKSRR